MKKAYQLAEKIIKDIEDYSAEYVTEEGKTVTTEAELKALNTIIEEGFTLYKYLVEKKLYNIDPSITVAVNELGTYVQKLQINEENAKKLHLSNVMQIWNQAKIAIAVLACALLDYRDEKEESK